MEAQMARAPGQGHREDVPDHRTDQMVVVDGEGEHAHDHDHEKTSVLKKVKDKAKKIKHNLTSNMHHGGHDDDQYRAHTSAVDEDDIEEYDKEEVIVTQPQLFHEVPVQESTVSSAVGEAGHVIEAKPRDNFAHGLGDAVLDSNLDRDPQAPMGASDKPHRGNYQSKVSDPTNNNNIEAQVGPLIGHLEALKVSDETGPTGSHDQFARSSENAPYKDSRYATDPASAVAPPENRPASYSEKISAATTAIAGTAVLAKEAIAEKLGYGSKDGRGQQIKAGQEGTTSAAGKIKETLAPVYEKVTGMGTAVASKISGEEAGKEATVEVGSSKNSLLGKLRPGDEDRALCEVISNVLHRKKGHEAVEAVEPETTKQVGELSGDGSTARSGSGNMVDQIKVAVTSFFVKGGDGGAGHGRLQEEGMEKREELRLEETGN